MIRRYQNNLNLFLRFCTENAGIEDADELDNTIIKQFTLFMSAAGRKGTYINGLLKNIKSFVQYCFDEGYGGFDTKKVFKWCKEDKPIITAFTPGQVKMGTDLYTISRLLGHENIAITQTYLNSLKDKDIINIAKQKSVLMNM